jgi:hypothetical protein
MTDIPTIRIKTSYLTEHWYNIAPMSNERVRELEKNWQRYEEHILIHLQDITGLSFAQNIIDVYVVDPDRLGGMSDPLTIGGATGKRRFIFMLAHELTHRLMECNTQGVDWHTMAWKMYPKENHLTAHHVIVHAVLEALFTTINKKNLLSEDIKISQKQLAYKRAWEIVEEEGYKNILDKIRKSYAKDQV